MSEPALRIQNLSKSFGTTKALDDVGFDVPQGSIFGLLGPNGAGKTTLFSIAAGFLRADAGSLRVLGVDIAHIAELQGRMTILPQDASFQKNVPILDQLVFLRQLDGSDRATAEREVTEALEAVGIAQYRKRGIHALSHGMLKRMGIAQAFLGRPEVILLDEPTSGLDPKNASQIRELVRELQRSRRVTTVISSHYLLEIEELCDHVAILDKGKVVVSGSLDEIRAQGRVLKLELPRVLTEAEVARIAAVAGVAAVVPRHARRYELTLASGDDAVVRDALRALLDLGIAPRSLSQGNSLLDFFLSVTGDGAATAPVSA
ncbi:MAG: ABC transporter ATP-binding protein [Planctomycetes bacterium]|nr:ABC transporter ATP-binding protein [Planctomycetota bacterium]